MFTQLLSLSALEPDAATIARAADVLRGGGLAAFPTETVYGLGANALDAAAVARIYEAKGRPPSNPVIAHLADLDQLRSLVAEWPARAEKLARHFWPGPLSLVLPKQAHVPDIVTAGGATVAVRMPAHPVAAALIRAAGFPLAAPSANRSTEISPTTAQHVLRALGGSIDLILDAGSTARGIESTVLDLTVDPPQLLRPGLIGRAELAEVLGGPVELGAHLRRAARRDPSDDSMTAASDVPARSPGLAERHYAPSAPLECHVPTGRERACQLAAAGERVGWLCWSGTPRPTGGQIEMIEMPREPLAYATRLYAALHQFEELGVTRIVVDPPPSDDERWLAVSDRLRRASAVN